MIQQKRILCNTEDIVGCLTNLTSKVLSWTQLFQFKLQHNTNAMLYV